MGDILDSIRSGVWEKQISALRSLQPKSVEYEKMKSRLPAFMISATTLNGGHRRTDIGKHTGLLQLDVDGVVASETHKLRNLLIQDVYVVAAWISPSGNGVKAVVRIPASLELHKASFQRARDYYSEQYGIALDPQCGDPCRLCFVGSDPELSLNSRAIEMKPQGGAATRPSSTSLPPASASTPTCCLLHNNTTDLFIQYPLLKPLYHSFVRCRIGTPQRGLRNRALVELVSSLHCVIHPQFILGFAEFFYLEHSELFSDYPQDEFTSQAECLIAGCSTSYLDELNEVEACQYAELADDLKQMGFRICRSLANCTSTAEFPPPKFHLSAENFGVRLGITTMAAYRMLGLFVDLGMIAIEKKGERRAAGVKARATVFRWLLGDVAQPF